MGLVRIQTGYAIPVIGQTCPYQDQLNNVQLVHRSVIVEATALVGWVSINAIECGSRHIKTLKLLEQSTGIVILYVYQQTHRETCRNGHGKN